MEFHMCDVSVPPKKMRELLLHRDGICSCFSTSVLDFIRYLSLWSLPSWNELKSGNNCISMVCHVPLVSFYALTKQMLFPFRSVCASLVFFCPAEVLSLKGVGV
jgi:hypothetical protein